MAMTWTEKMRKGLHEILNNETWGLSRHKQDRSMIDRIHAALRYCQVRETRRMKKYKGTSNASTTQGILGSTQPG